MIVQEVSSYMNISENIVSNKLNIAFSPHINISEITLLQSYSK